MLRADVPVPEQSRLFLGQDDHSTRLIGEPFEHVPILAPARVTRVTIQEGLAHEEPARAVVLNAAEQLVRLRKR
jgi:hypothetical protein